MLARFVSALSLSLPCLLPCGALLAQGVVPPLQLTQVNPVPGLSTSFVPTSDVQQMHAIHLPSDPPNLFYVGLTGNGLQATFGGVGGSDVLTGTYDVLTDTFTPNSEAAALNTAGTEFGLMIHHSGLYAVVDRLPGAPWLASRAAVGQPWAIVGQVGPIASQSYYDPSLATYQGQIWLLHVQGTDIARTRIDVTTGALIGSPIIVARAARAGSTANSPTPVTDPNGELIGISHHDVLGSDNDHYMSLDLDPATPAVLMNDTAGWSNNGCFIGGRFFDAESAPAPYHIFSIDTYWFTGGRCPVGGTMTVRLFAPPTSGSGIYLSLFAGSDAFLPTGFSIPGIGGLVGINPATLSATSMALHNNLDGEAQITFTIPNTPSLSGARLPVQSATLDGLVGQFHIGNTAQLAID